MSLGSKVEKTRPCWCMAAGGAYSRTRSCGCMSAHDSDSRFRAAGVHPSLRGRCSQHTASRFHGDTAGGGVPKSLMSANQTQASGNSGPGGDSPGPPPGYPGDWPLPDTIVTGPRPDWVPGPYDPYGGGGGGGKPVRVCVEPSVANPQPCFALYKGKCEAPGWEVCQRALIKAALNYARKAVIAAWERNPSLKWDTMLMHYFGSRYWMQNADWYHRAKVIKRIKNMGAWILHTPLVFLKVKRNVGTCAKCCDWRGTTPSWCTGSGTIKVCPRYWNIPVENRDVPCVAKLLLHEASHLAGIAGDRNDPKYGLGNALTLALSDNYKETSHMGDCYAYFFLHCLQDPHLFDPHGGACNVDEHEFPDNSPFP